MIEGTLKNGFAYKIDAEALADDFELLELYAKVSESIIHIPELLVKLLGKEQAEALKDHLRGPDGRVKSSDIFDALGEIEEVIPQAVKN